MLRAIALGSVVSLLACSAAQKSMQPNALARRGGDRALFVGHTRAGEVVVAAKHYDAMNGLAVMSEDVEATDADGGGELLCRREELTGSHLPQWICRYKEDQARVSEEDRRKARAFLQGLPVSCTDGCVNK